MSGEDRSHPRGMLAGVKVVECGDGVAAAFAAKMMADLGADVIKIETRGGDFVRQRGPFPHDQPDPEKSGLFLYLNNNKAVSPSITLGPKGADSWASCCLRPISWCTTFIRAIARFVAWIARNSRTSFLR
jgi:hypothetical protein